MRDGIVIKQHKGWNTKQVWVHGHLAMQYRRVPKHVGFVSPMVNDENQDLCGGIARHDRPREMVVIVDRVLAGLKPLGSTVFFGVEAAGPSIDRVVESKLPYSVYAVTGHHPYGSAEPWIFAEVCQRGTLREEFDLDALVAAYRRSGVAHAVADEVQGALPAFADRTLASFFGRFDTNCNPAWVTGLVLDYPIENTIACYYGGVA